MENSEKVVNALSNASGLAPQRNTLATLLGSTDVRKRFDDMLGKKAAGFVSSIISATSTNKNLKLCDPRSVISSAAIAASLDLPINPNLGFAHIVPYGGKAQFQMGWTFCPLNW